MVTILILRSLVRMKYPGETRGWVSQWSYTKTLLLRSLCATNLCRKSVILIGILKNNREKEKDLVATGILPVILNKQAGSLSHLLGLASRPYSLSHRSAEPRSLSPMGTRLLRTTKICGRQGRRPYRSRFVSA